MILPKLRNNRARLPLIAERIIERIVGHDVIPVVPDVIDRKAGFAPELLLDLEVPLEELRVEKLPANVIEGGRREQRGCSLQVCQGRSVCKACLEGGIGLNVCVIQAAWDDRAVDIGRNQAAISIEARYIRRIGDETIHDNRRVQVGE